MGKLCCVEDTTCAVLDLFKFRRSSRFADDGGCQDDRREVVGEVAAVCVDLADKMELLVDPLEIELVVSKRFGYESKAFMLKLRPTFGEEAGRLGRP